MESEYSLACPWVFATSVSFESVGLHSNTTPLRSILILFYRLRLGLLRCLFTSGLLNTILYAFLMSPAVTYLALTKVRWYFFISVNLNISTCTCTRPILPPPPPWIRLSLFPSHPSINLFLGRPLDLYLADLSLFGILSSGILFIFNSSFVCSVLLLALLIPPLISF